MHTNYMSNRYVNWAQHVQGITGVQKAVLMAIARFADERGYCRPSRADLAYFSSTNVRTTSRAITDLERMGLIQIVYRLALTNVYILAEDTLVVAPNSADLNSREFVDRESYEAEFRKTDRISQSTDNTSCMVENAKISIFDAICGVGIGEYAAYVAQGSSLGVDTLSPPQIVTPLDALSPPGVGAASRGVGAASRGVGAASRGTPRKKPSNEVGGVTPCQGGVDSVSAVEKEERSTTRISSTSTKTKKSTVAGTGPFPLPSVFSEVPADLNLTVETMRATWNEAVAGSPIPCIRTVLGVPRRTKAMLATLNVINDCGVEWGEFCRMVVADPFLRGEINGAGHGNWVGTLDYVCRDPSTAVRIIEKHAAKGEIGASQGLASQASASNEAPSQDRLDMNFEKYDPEIEAINAARMNILDLPRDQRRAAAAKVQADTDALMARRGLNHPPRAQ